MKVLNLSKNELDDTKVKQLAALLEDKHCKLKTLLLSDCGLTERSCSTLATVLSNTNLKELDISHNNLLDSGVEKLQNELKNTNCKLEKLRMSTCSITEAGYNSLALALELNPSHLTELDLTGNDPGESGVKKLIDVPKKSNCTLKTLKFLEGPAEEACRNLMKVLNENPLLMRELNLSKNTLGNTTVNQLAALLRDKHCKLKKIQLCECSIKVKQCEILTAALRSNPSYLRELSLSNNKIKNGVKHIGDLLKDPNCKLENLELRNCSLIDEDYSSLISSSLKRLYLSGNELGDAGVKNLCVLLRSSETKLETLELCGCSITEKQCADLSAALRSNLSYLRELNLSGNAIKDGVRDLFELLNYSDCKLEKLELCKCSITDKHCEILTAALCSKHSSLRELNLSENDLKNKGLKHLCDILNNSHCKLEKLG
ncbi:ribonuclease inhibitor-like [Misgurnus anguillicaudatus]|uniref:ribonuclease inhibitor-like n=1 Tax=Misgurnus anguillicaudatus TaxID=75329 RepID=UPI003CCF3098